MPKLDPNDDDARAQVKLFYDLVFDLRILHDIGKELFYDEQAQWLMQETAHHFFLDLNRIVIEYFLLQMAKLTDPASSNTREGRAENFTIANLLENIEWPKDVLVELTRLSQAVCQFRKHIKPARNQILAHYDKKTIMSGAIRGAFPEGEDDKVVNVLEDMCNVLHKASFGEVCGEMAQGHGGDVRDLKLALRKAIAFDAVLGSASTFGSLLRENATEELRGLMLKCLNDTREGHI